MKSLFEVIEVTFDVTSEVIFSHPKVETGFGPLYGVIDRVDSASDLLLRLVLSIMSLSTLVLRLASSPDVDIVTSVETGFKV